MTFLPLPLSLTAWRHCTVPSDRRPAKHNHNVLDWCDELFSLARHRRRYAIERNTVIGNLSFALNQLFGSDDFSLLATAGPCDAFQTEFFIHRDNGESFRVQSGNLQEICLFYKRYSPQFSWSVINLICINFSLLQRSWKIADGYIDLFKDVLTSKVKLKLNGSWIHRQSRGPKKRQIGRFQTSLWSNAYGKLYLC